MCTSFMYYISLMIYAYIISGWWFGIFCIFPYNILGIIIPTDFHIFERGWNHQADSYCWRLLVITGDWWRFMEIYNGYCSIYWGWNHQADFFYTPRLKPSLSNVFFGFRRGFAVTWSMRSWRNLRSPCVCPPPCASCWANSVLPKKTTGASGND